MFLIPESLEKRGRSRLTKPFKKQEGIRVADRDVKK